MAVYSAAGSPNKIGRCRYNRIAYLDEADEGEILEAGLVMAVLWEEELAHPDAILTEVVHLRLHMVLQLSNRLQPPAIAAVWRWKGSKILPENINTENGRGVGKSANVTRGKIYVRDW